MTTKEKNMLKKLSSRYFTRKEKAEILIHAVRTKQFDGIIDVIKYANGIRSIISGEIHITEYISKESGKMIGIPALGTTCHITENCKRNIENAIAANDLNCPCLHCYSALGTVYDFDSMHLIVNHDRLQEIVSNEELTNIAKHAIKVAITDHKIDGIVYPATYSIRIQHKGDVDSIIEAANYAKFANIVKSINPAISVTAYTKFPEIYSKAMNIFPEIDFNALRIGYSAYKFGENGIAEVLAMKAMFPFLKFGFVVYERIDGITKASDNDNRIYVEKHFSELVKEYPLYACKCDPGSCGKCGICYGHNINSDFIVVCELCR